MSPAVDEATRANAETGRRMADLAERQAERGNALIDRFAPTYDKILQSNLGAGEEARTRANEQWDHYSKTFQPVEKKIAEEAMNYDSESEIQRRTGMAAGTVQKHADAAAEQNARRMASMGISPTSGRTQQSMTDNQNLTAMAKAGAVNQERSNTKQQGFAMRSAAAGLGRGITATSAQQSGIGLSANGAAINGMGAQTGQMAGAMAPAAGLYQGSVSATNSSGQLGLGRFNSQMASNQADANSVGSAVGSVIGAVAMMYSSKDGKKNIKPVDDGEAMEAMRKVPAKQWDYKEGVADGGSHVGPIAEDMQAAAGDEVAPGGKQIDMISMLGMQHAATRDVDARLQAVEKKLGTKGSKPAKAQAPRAPRYAMSMEPLPL